jgi:hypothetical protein
MRSISETEKRALRTAGLETDGKRRERVIRGQWLAAGDILEIKDKTIRDPDARLGRPAISLPAKQRSSGAADVNFDDSRIGRAPTDGGLA